MKKTIVAAASLLLFTLGQGALASLVNPSFEDGGLGWNSTDDHYVRYVPRYYTGDTLFLPTDGETFAMVITGEPTARLWQEFYANPNDTLSFSWGFRAGDYYNDYVGFDIAMGGVAFTTLYTGLLADVDSVGQFSDKDWAEMTLALDFLPPGSGNPYILSFFAVNAIDHTFSSVLFVDDVSVSQPGGGFEVPVPTSLLLMGLGVVSLVLSRRRESRG